MQKSDERSQTAEEILRHRMQRENRRKDKGSGISGCIKSAAGFTMVEMLVVISIIVILASMILPVLMSAKKGGMAAKCKSNLRQFGIGCVAYRTDNDEILPGRLIGLYPKYTDIMKIFLCPADMSRGREGGKPDSVDNEDWEHATDEDGSSYFYEFSEVKCEWDFSSIGTVAQVTGDPDAAEASWNQVKYYQLEHGDDYNDYEPYPEDRFPVVRCFWHTVNPDDENEKKIILNLAFSGRIFESGPTWEKTAVE